MDSVFSTKLRSPRINYLFIEDIFVENENIQKDYSGIENTPARNPGWRDDFQFLF